MLSIALKMLVRDRAKYAILISGLTFCALLITQQASIFCGIMLWTTSTVRNVNVPVWVADRNTERADDPISMRDIEVDRVRSLPGVKWAVPLYWGIVQIRLPDGKFQTCQLVGLDNATLIGRPSRVHQGRVEDVRQPNAMVVDQVFVEKMKKKGYEVKPGMTFEISDQLARVVAICECERTFLGFPYLFTTYDRIPDYVPKQRKRLTYVLAAPADGTHAEDLARRADALPNMRAWTGNQLFWNTMWWYILNTGIPLAIGAVVLLGMVVGFAISGQTFYLFVSENLRYLAAFKAMGAGNRLLTRMVLLQSVFVGLIGYGLGVGLATGFGALVLQTGSPPYYMPWHLLAFTFVMVMAICAFSALLGLRRVFRLEAAVVFR